jgi:hypothetical protein
LRLAGSLSTPLATTTVGPDAAATAASLRPAGKAAPPRPVSPDRLTSSISCRLSPRDLGIGGPP